MQKASSSAVSRRRFLGVTSAAVAGVSLVPRHVLGGAGFVAPSEKINIAIVGCGGQGHTNIRALFQQQDAQIVALADPAESHDLDGFYYKGNAGRLPVKEAVEKHYSQKTPGYKVADYEDFRADAGEGKGHRRHPVRHARPPPRLCVRDGDEAGQACLLRETAHA